MLSAPGQNLQAIFDSPGPFIQKPHPCTHSVTSLWSGQAPLLSPIAPTPAQASSSTSHMNCFKNYPSHVLSLHLYLLIYFTHCCQTSSENKLTSNYCFSQECFTISLPKELHSRFSDLTLTLKPPGANKSKEAMRFCPIRFVESGTLFITPGSRHQWYERTSVRESLQTDSKCGPAGESKREEEWCGGIGWVWHSGSALSRSSDLGQLMDLLSIPVSFKQD